MFVRRLTTFLICFAIAVTAGDVCASIVVPEAALELSADDVLSAAGDSGATASTTSRSQVRGPSAPLPQLEEIGHLGLVAYAGPLGSSNSSNMGGSSSPSFGSGSGTLAVTLTTSLQSDDALVGWLNQSRWLDIPMPPGVSLLRPPQAV